MTAPRTRPELRIWTVWAGVGLCAGLALGDLPALGLLLLPAAVATVLLRSQVGIRREAWGVVAGMAVLPLAMVRTPAAPWPSLAASGMVLLAAVILFVVPSTSRRL